MEKFTPESLNITPIYDDEYFIHMKVYGDDAIPEFEQYFYISNYGRVYSQLANKLLILPRGKHKDYVVGLMYNGYRAAKSLPKLMMYNFTENFNWRYMCFIIDKSKPCTVDNISMSRMNRLELTEEQKQLIKMYFSHGYKMGRILKMIPKSYPKNASERYCIELFGNYSVKPPNSKLEEFVDGLTSTDIESKGFKNIIKEYCDKNDLPFNDKLYYKCYRYLRGEALHININ